MVNVPSDAKHFLQFGMSTGILAAVDVNDQFTFECFALSGLKRSVGCSARPFTAFSVCAVCSNERSECHGLVLRHFIELIKGVARNVCL